MNVKIGIIPGIVRDEMRRDREGTLRHLAQLGYRGIEGAVLVRGDAAEGKRLLDSLGMKAVTVSAKRERLATGLDELIETARELDALHVTTWWGPCEEKDALLRDAELYDTAGARIAEAGLKFCYHNHDHEFKATFDGRRGIDILMEHTDPASVSFEIDVAWVRYGGDDPAAFIRDHAERIPVIHLKDIADLEKRGTFTAVGTGVVDVRAVLEAAEASGVEWAIVEQDRPHNLTPMESVAASMLNLREMGLA